MQSSHSRPRLDRRGVALPIALVGLIAVSLLITSALLSSATESAISGAQRDAAAGIYRADAALQGYVAQQAALTTNAGSRFVDSATPTTYVQNGTSYSIRTARLAYSWLTQNNGAATVDSATETWGLTATPANGYGRSVGALLSTDRTFARFTVSTEAGLVSGGSVNVKGNSTISDGSDNLAACGTAGQNALTVTNDGSINVDGAAKIVGGSNTANYSKDQLVAKMLGGMSLDSLSTLASIKFAPREYSTTRVNTDPSTAAKYNWGCPLSMDTALSCNFSTLAKDTANYPIVSIDAGGGSVTINGDYGQGILIVKNGSLRIQGKFNFKGLVLVSQDFTIAGTGGGDVAKIDGSVLALGQNSIDADNVTGNATIRFNRCSLAAATNAANKNGLLNAAQKVNAGTYSWFEVVR